MPQIQLIIDSDLANVCFATLAVNRLCLHLGLDEIAACKVELCVAEALTNVILHGYCSEPGRSLCLLFDSAEDELHIEITDTGKAMPPEFVDRLLHGNKESEFCVADLDLLDDHGRGLQIIHSVMDKIAYASDADRNRLRLTKTLAIAHPS